MHPDPLPDPLALAIRCLREIADRQYAEPADNISLDAGHWARAHALFGLHQIEGVAPGVTGEPPRRAGALRLFGLTSEQKAELAKPRKLEAERQRQRRLYLRRKQPKPPAE